MMPRFIHFGAGGGGSLAKTYEASAANASDLATHTFSGVSFGAAAADRELMVVVMGRFAASALRAITSITIGGVAAAVETLQAVISIGGITVARVTLPTGTSGDVVVTWSGNVSSTTIAVYRVTGRAAAGSAASGLGSAYVILLTSLSVGSIAIPAGGFLLGGMFSVAVPSAYSGLATTLDATAAPDSEHWQARSTGLQGSAVSGESMIWTFPPSGAGLAAWFAYAP